MTPLDTSCRAVGDAMTAPTMSLPAWQAAIIADLEHRSWWDFADAVRRYTQEYPTDPLGLGQVIPGHLRALSLTTSLTEPQE